MILQTDPFSRTFELFRDLGTSLLSGSEEMASWQFDSLQESMTRNTQQLRTAMSEASAAQEPAQWIITEAMNEQLVMIDVAASREKFNGKAATLAQQKIAA